MGQSSGQRGTLNAQRIAKMVKGEVSYRTIQNWVEREELKHLFSDGAADNNFNEHDLFMVNTILHMRNNGYNDFEEIASKIDEGYVIDDLALSTAEVDPARSAIKQFEDLHEMRMHLKQAETRIQQLEDQLAEERNRGESAAADERDRNEKLQRQLQKAREEIGYLKGILSIQGVQYKRFPDDRSSSE